MQAGNLAARYGVHLALEANPPMYTNYLNGTADAFALVKRLGQPRLVGQSGPVHRAGAGRALAELH